MHCWKIENKPMDSITLVKLLEVRDAINHDGWIVIPPTGNYDSIEVRVKWYINGEKYGFSTTFEGDVLRLGNFDFTEAFVREANNAIERLLGDE